MNRRLIISFVIFLVVVVATSLMVTFPEDVNAVENGVMKDPDLNYYVEGGTFGTGHDLTIAISQPLAKVSIYLLPVVFFTVFAAGVYYMIKPFVKYPEWAFLVAPLTPLTTVLAQIFSIGLFWFVLGFYFRYKKNPKRIYMYSICLFLFLACLAHFWGGICMLAAFGFFMVIDKRPKLIGLVLPALALLVVVALHMQFTPAGMFTPDFMQYAPGEIPTFFSLFTRQMSFLLSAGVGVFWLALYREWGFLKIIVPLLLFPILLMLFLPYDWVWRLFYFMPLLPLTSVVMSYVFEGRKLKLVKLRG